MPNFHNYMKSVVHGDSNTRIGRTFEFQNTREIRKNLEKESEAIDRFKEGNPMVNIKKDVSFEVLESKLALLILTYIYSQDDQEISNKERKSIVKLLNSQNIFSCVDVTEILSFLDNLPTINYVIDYIIKNSISQSAFENAYRNVYKHMKHNKVYDKLLRELKTKII